jgi:hypothetical protein
MIDERRGLTLDLFGDNIGLRITPVWVHACLGLRDVDMSIEEVANIMRQNNDELTRAVIDGADKLLCSIITQKHYAGSADGPSDPAKEE